VGFIAVFIPVFAGVVLAGNWVHKGVEVAGLGWFDKWIGGLLGLLIGFLIIGTALVILEKHPVGGSERWIQGSVLAQFIIKIMRSLLMGRLLQRTPREVTG